MIQRHLGDGVRHRPVPIHPTAPIFAWSGGGVVLLGERAADRWVVARGWRQGDRLGDVRRWSFADPRAFAGQIRRLAAEASGDRAAAVSVGTAALAWTEIAGA